MSAIRTSTGGLGWACALGALLSVPAPLAAQAVVIANVSIVDASAPDSVRISTIVVDNGRIQAIGAAPPVPEGARTIDGRGKFVVPGLWEMHAHLAALTPVGLAPERYVGHGVLNVRDMGGHTDVLLPLRSAIRGGERIGPEIVLAGPTLNSTQPADFHRKVTSAAEARAVVAELQAAGVDFVKIHRGTNREVFEAIADETRRRGLAFAGHVPLVMGWIEASNAGMRTIAARAARAGVPLITGTDVLARHGEMLLRELEQLVAIGLTPQEVLAAATVTSAEAAQRPELGRVTVGSPASFLVLDANPLVDITHLRAISAVVLRTKVLGVDDLRTLRR